MLLSRWLRYLHNCLERLVSSHVNFLKLIRIPALFFWYLLYNAIKTTVIFIPVEQSLTKSECYKMPPPLATSVKFCITSVASKHRMRQNYLKTYQHWVIYSFQFGFENDSTFHECLSFFWGNIVKHARECVDWDITLELMHSNSWAEGKQPELSWLICS